MGREGGEPRSVFYVVRDVANIGSRTSGAGEFHLRPVAGEIPFQDIVDGCAGILEEMVVKHEYTGLGFGRKDCRGPRLLLYLRK